MRNTFNLSSLWVNHGAWMLLVPRQIFPDDQKIFLHVLHTTKIRQSLRKSPLLSLLIPRHEVKTREVYTMSNSLFGGA